MSPTSSVQPQGVWPPGPAAGLTGWSLLLELARDPIAALGRWQREFGDLVHLRIWPEHEIVVSDPLLVRELLVAGHDGLIRWERGMRVFEKVDGHSVLIAEGQAWKRKRAALRPSFSPQSVHATTPTIVAAAGQAFAHWPTQAQRWPIESQLTELTMDVIVRMMFSTGIGTDARAAEAAVHTLLATSNAELYWPASWPDWMPWKRKKWQALRTLEQLIEKHLQARLNTGRDVWPADMLSRLLDMHLQDPHAWTLQAVRDECRTMFIAGHETVAATLSWWAWCMAAHPDIQARARKEVQQVLGDAAPTPDTLGGLPYLGQTLQETLRLYPVAPVLNTRRSTRPLTLGSRNLPAGTMFVVPVHTIHHDARWYPEPEAFKPERFGPDTPKTVHGAYLPFGVGPRVCLGQHLAMTELTVIAAMLLQRFALSIPADVAGAAAPRAVLNISLRPEKALHLDIAPL